MNVKTIITKDFTDELIENLNKIGITTYNIECILVEGSSLYIDKPNDLDFKVIVKRYVDKAEIIKVFDIQGYKVECCYYTFNDWAKVMNYKIAYFIAETPDMICVYGNDEEFKRYDPVSDIEVQKHLISVYDKCLFNYTKENKKSYKFLPKRLWNFLLFAFKFKNNSNTLDNEQLLLLQKAHDLKLDKEDYRPLFEEIKSTINNK